jgi:hypothetical protein
VGAPKGSVTLLRPDLRPLTRDLVL